MPLSEFNIIEQYFSHITSSREDVILGIGDDCALLAPPPEMQLAVSMDTLVAGRHFLPDADPAAVGHKSLAVNLSDLAAMGADPAWVTLAITLPEPDENWLSGFARGFSKLAQSHAIQLVGGDTTRGPLSVTLQVHGFVEPDKALRRQGAQPGDGIYLTGSLGDAALALKLQSGNFLLAGDTAQLFIRLDRPEPRVAQGLLLAGLASAAIDLSDGLLADLGHICKASGTAARIRCDRLPLSARVSEYVAASGDWQLPVTGGDDYELCFTVPPALEQTVEEKFRAAGFDLSRIGRIEPGNRIIVLQQDGRELGFQSSGFDHFNDEK